MHNSRDYINRLAKNIKPIMAYESGMSVEEWQKEAREKLEELLGLPLVKCPADFKIIKETVCADYTRYDFTFQSEPGYYVPCALLVPKNACGLLPVAICLQGHSTGMHISLGETKFSGDQETINAGKIILMGNSGGGTVTFYASCMDERISLSMPSCAVCTYDDSIMAMNHCPCNFIPNIRKYFNMGDVGVLIAPRPFVLVCGETDPIFPLPGVKESFEIIKSAYEDLGKSKLCHIVIGNGGHQFYPDDAWPVAKTLL